MQILLEPPVAPARATRPARTSRISESSDLQRRLFTVKEYERLHRQGLLRPDEPALREEGLRVPRPRDALLLIEVADSTLRTDLGPKARLHAKHRVPEYWVFDLAGRRVIVHRDPARGGYRTLLEARPPEVVAPLALPKAGVDLEAIFRGCE